MKNLFVLLMIVIVISGCSGGSKSALPYEPLGIAYYEIPQDWKDTEIRNSTMATFSKYVEGYKIFIDPGHGGDDRRNRSISEKVIEADVNLNVAKYLREYLEQSGAVVIMAREDDETLSLQERSELANESNAHLFLSIHHNAAGTNNYWANYTSTFYHAREDDYEYEPFERVFARYIQRDLAYVMRNSGGLGSFDGTYSDYMIFPEDGFSVLRRTEIPAILIECSFHTNRLEEERLVEDEFNQIQAWGIYRGIAKFLSRGFPKIHVLKEHSKLEDGNLELICVLDDQSGIDEKTIEVFMDSVKVEHKWFEEMSLVKVNIDSVTAGEHTFRIDCANKKGNYAFPFYKKIITNITPQ